MLEALAKPTLANLHTNGGSLLSAREIDVVRCVAEGLTNREIAQRLKLTEHTVKNYLFRIFDKLERLQPCRSCALCPGRRRAAEFPRRPRIAAKSQPIAASFKSASPIPVTIRKTAT